MNTQYEHCPWLNPANWEGDATTSREKAVTRFEYAFESISETNTKFKEILPEGTHHIPDSVENS